jgi:hypothetical protein
VPKVLNEKTIDFYSILYSGRLWKTLEKGKIGSGKD